MSSLVKELENDILEDKDILLILRKALIISKRLGLTEFEKWITFERQGYEDGSNLPDYRIINCELVEDKLNGTLALGYIARNVPVKIHPEIDNLARKLYLTFPINEINNLCESEDKIRFNAPPVILEFIGHPFVYRTCRKYQLQNIIQQVKDTLLEWCLDLENQGIFGENFNFTDEEQDNAKNITFNILAYDSSIQIGENMIYVNNEVKRFVFDNLNEIKEVLYKYGVDESVKKEILSEVNCIEQEIQKKDSNFNIVEKSIESIKRIGEGALAGVVAQIIFNNLDKISDILSLMSF